MIRFLIGAYLAAGLTLAASSAPAAAQKNPVGQVAAVEAAAARDSLDPVTHYELALAYLEARRWADADRAFERVVELDPRKAEGWLGRSVAQDRNRDFWSALRRGGGDSAVARERRARDQHMRRAFFLDPFVDIAPLWYGYAGRFGFPEMALGAFDYVDALLTRLRSRGQPLDSVPPGLLWTHGVLSARTGRYPQAARDLATLIHQMQRYQHNDSTHRVPLPINEVRYVLAAVQQRGGNREQAITLYTEVFQNDVGHYMSQVRLAQVHEGADQWSQAINARRCAIESNPDDPTLHLDLGATLLNARFTARAESVLVGIRPQLPRDPRLYYLLGRVEETLGKNDEARAAYENFIQLAPSRWADAIADARLRLERLR